MQKRLTVGKRMEDGLIEVRAPADPTTSDEGAPRVLHLLLDEAAARWLRDQLDALLPKRPVTRG